MRSFLFYESRNINTLSKKSVEEARQFFCSLYGIEIPKSKNRLKLYFTYVNKKPVIINLPREIPSNFMKLRLLPVNPYIEASSAWSWHRALNDFENAQKNSFEAGQNYKNLANVWKQNYELSIIFGTGPSLSTYDKFEYTSSFRVACNTIVKDYKTLKWINPHVVTAGDALYHFSHTEHSQRFMNDLKKAMSEFSFIFVYPDLFDRYVRAYLNEFENRLFPIPNGLGTMSNLMKEWVLPSRNNVLNLLLIPIATTVSDNLRLLGFDGRKKADNGFWSNSDIHSYPDSIAKLKKSHPAFFALNVPDSDPLKYSRSVFDEQLKLDIAEIVNRGGSVKMLSPSTSPVLSDLEVINFV